MKVNPRDLRIDPQRLDAPEHVIEQLSALASESAGKPARHRGVIVAGVTVGVLTLGMGGAWASGTIEVPGLPKPGRSAPVDPAPRDRPAPTPTTSDAPTPNDSPEATQPGADGRPDDRLGRTPERTPSTGAGADPDEKVPGQGEVEKRRPDHAGKPESPGRSDDAGMPDQTGKPVSPRGSAREKPSKQGSGPPRSSGATGQRSAKRSDRAQAAAAHVEERRDG